MSGARWRWTKTDEGLIAPDPGRERYNRFRISLSNDRYVVRVESLDGTAEYVIGTKRTLRGARRLAQEFHTWRR